MNEFHEIKVLRKECKVKQYELAELLGIEQANYSNIENGRLIPKHIDIIKFRAKSILIPKLDKVIKRKHFELEYLKYMRKELK